MSLTDELTTVRDYIRYATSRFNELGLFFGHGTDNAWDEAIALVFHALHLPHSIPPAVLDAKLTAEERSKIIAMIKKRADDRVPLPYLTHEAWFCELPFFVDERVLIPRSPIAELVEKGFAPWIEAHQVNAILDLCTGSGCIAIASAKVFPDAIVHASDYSENALAVAKINTLKHAVENQVELIHSDLFENISHTAYDIIVTNPPYVDAEDMASLPIEYHHEPKDALQAGFDGLDCATTILKTAAKHLTPHGILIVEVGNSEHALIQKYPHIPFTWLEFERGGGGIFLLTKTQLDTISV